jgi:hypothetical protein
MGTGRRGCKPGIGPSWSSGRKKIWKTKRYQILMPTIKNIFKKLYS